MMRLKVWKRVMPLRITGKDKLLKVMEPMADYIDSLFGVSKRTGIPGHQEIEIGLMKMYHATGKENTVS